MISRSIPGEPEAYRRDVPKAEVHIVDGGHFALDTAADEIAAARPRLYRCCSSRVAWAPHECPRPRQTRRCLLLKR